MREIFWDVETPSENHFLWCNARDSKGLSLGFCTQVTERFPSPLLDLQHAFSRNCIRDNVSSFMDYFIVALRVCTEFFLYIFQCIFMLLQTQDKDYIESRSRAFETNYTQ